MTTLALLPRYNGWAAVGPRVNHLGLLPLRLGGKALHVQDTMKIARVPPFERTLNTRTGRQTIQYICLSKYDASP